jgi:hypothetical protein
VKIRRGDHSENVSSTTGITPEILVQHIQELELEECFLWICRIRINQEQRVLYNAPDLVAEIRKRIWGHVIRVSQTRVATFRQTEWLLEAILHRGNKDKRSTIT